MAQLPDPLDHRQAAYPIEPLFVRRWSPRSLSGEPLSEQELMTLFEAARWAPSTYNEQEWRFLYARQGSPEWPLFFELLVEGNQVWCQRAAVLAVVLSHKLFARNGKPNAVHVYDSGAAWENLALQAASMDLVAHGMVGFDMDQARRVLEVPDDYSVNAMFALGRPGNPQDLPESVRAGEVPSDRKPVSEIICEGKFRF